MNCTVYQIKVTIRNSRPPIWRRFQVFSDITLYQLHGILQVVMGWTNSHLHQFRAGGIYYGKPDKELGMDVKNEKGVRLNKVLPKIKDRIVYEYDFGDGWEHDLVLENILSAEPEGKYPIAVKGKRACPPEDVGGIWGYGDFLEAIKNPNHPEHKTMIEWCGGSFDPEEFDIDEINWFYHPELRKKDA